MIFEYMKNRMIYSGIITSYVCSAECRHCLYCSSPQTSRDFITAEAAENIAGKLSAGGIRSMHIGGGEPFLNFASLCGLLHAMMKYKVGVDYIETNAFWCMDEETVRRRLAVIRDLGVHTVMVSVDPFHMEYIPLARPLLFIKILGEIGMDHFVWQEKFLRRLSLLDHTQTYTEEELKLHLGAGYIGETAREYGLGMNGRALIIAGSLYKRKKAETFLHSEPCRSLLDGYHCHIDLYDNYIPSGCPGLAVEADDYFTGNISETKYPVMTRLLNGGVGELYEYASGNGFVPSTSGYVTKCELCFFIRSLLRKTIPSRDISPDCFYDSMHAAYLKAGII